MDIIKRLKMGGKGVVIKLLWLVVLKICFEKLATISLNRGADLALWRCSQHPTPLVQLHHFSFSAKPVDKIVSILKLSPNLFTRKLSMWLNYNP